MMAMPRILYHHPLYYGDSVTLFSEHHTGLIIVGKKILFIQSVILCLELCNAFFMGILDIWYNTIRYVCMNVWIIHVPTAVFVCAMNKELKK